MNLHTALRLALAGTRTDHVRVLLTALGAAVATVGLLAVATVLSIRHPDNALAPYSSGLLAEPGLRPGLSLALVLSTIPVLFFVAQCSRLGAPARDRRLAAYRMGGATPGQTAKIAAMESGVATALGTLLGALIYFVGRLVLDAPNANGIRPLPTDVLPSAAAVTAVLIGVPTVAAGLSLLLLRRVSLTPLGVVRRSHDRRVRSWPMALVVGGMGAALAFQAVVEGSLLRGTDVPEWLFIPLAFTSTLLVALGLVAGTGWFSATGGRLLHRCGRGPAALLAGRWLIADPWAGSRLLGVIVITVLLGAGTAVVRSLVVTQSRAWSTADGTRAAGLDATRVSGTTSTAFDLIRLAVLIALAVAAVSLLVMLAEQIVTRRRSLASLVAAGTPRTVLARALVLQTTVPLIPAILIATTAGATMAAAVTPDTAYGVQTCTAQGSCTPRVEFDVPIPWDELSTLASGSILTVLAVTVIGTLMLRPSTDVAELRTE